MTETDGAASGIPGFEGGRVYGEMPLLPEGTDQRPAGLPRASASLEEEAETRNSALLDRRRSTDDK